MGTTSTQLAIGLSITESALIRRINRKFAHDGETLHKTRPGRGYGGHELGYYHITDCNNCLTSAHQDLEALGRELGVLKATEHLQEEGEA